MNLLTLFGPEIALSSVALALLGCMLGRHRSYASIRTLMLLGIATVLAVCAMGIRQGGSVFSGTYNIDLLSQGFKTLLSAALFFTVLLTAKTASFREERRIEYFFFLCTGTLGMMMLTSAGDLLTLYVSLELSAYSLYLLSALREDGHIAEASLKYLLFGAATSGFFLWGASLLSGLVGSTAIADIARSSPVLATQPVFILSMFLILLAFLFKLSAFPVHFWAPDVYESASTPVTTFIATASKAAAVAILIRFFMAFGLPVFLLPAVGFLAFASMTVGNTAALVQKDVKRLLAYSSIAQAGYILVGLMAASPDGYASSFFYALAYVLMNTGAFFVTAKVAEAARQDNPQISDFNGLAERSPFLALVLLLSLLSLAGIPPLVGFTGKWILFSAAMDKGHWFLVLWGVLNSVVSLFYYLTLVKHSYLEKPKDGSPITLSMSTKLLGLFLFCALILLGVFPNAFISFAQEAVLKTVLA